MNRYVGKRISGYVELTSKLNGITITYTQLWSYVRGQAKGTLQRWVRYQDLPITVDGVTLVDSAGRKLNARDVHTLCLKATYKTDLVFVDISLFSFE